MANKSINECICKYCGKKYIARNPLSNCCKDLQCLKAANHETYSVLNPRNFRYLRTCNVCGENYMTNNRTSKCCNNGYCSAVIGTVNKNKLYPPNHFQDCTCINCGKVFQTKYGTTPQKFCGVECKLEDNFKKLEEEFVGNKFGMLTVTHLQREYRHKRDAVVAYATCDCGGKTSVRADNLRDGTTTSCGCQVRSTIDEGGHGLLQYLRRKISSWYTDSINACEGKCDISGIPGGYAVHHLYPFAEIVAEALMECGLECIEVAEYTEEELSHLTETFLRLHNEKYPLGRCISKGLHLLFHGTYGSVRFTPENYYEFKQRCLDGEFGDLSKYRSVDVVRKCSYCGTTDGTILGRRGKLGQDFCKVHYSQMLSKGHCYEVAPPKPKKLKVGQRPPSSGYSGIQWVERWNKWTVRATGDPARKFLGSYKTLDEAVAARNAYLSMPC